MQTAGAASPWDGLVFIAVVPECFPHAAIPPAGTYLLVGTVLGQAGDVNPASRASASDSPDVTVGLDVGRLNVQVSNQLLHADRTVWSGEEEPWRRGRSGEPGSFGRGTRQRRLARNTATQRPLLPLEAGHRSSSSGTAGSPVGSSVAGSRREYRHRGDGRPDLV
jgi:hypothetical protein